MADPLPLLLRIEDSLLQVEAQSSLLATLSAGVVPGEIDRLAAVLESARAEPAELTARFARRSSKADVQRLSAVLSAARLALSRLSDDVRGELLLRRAEELQLELSMLGCEAGEELRRLATARFATVSPYLDAARSLAVSWLDRAADRELPTVDLATELLRYCRTDCLDVPVRAVEMVSRAAVGGDCLLVRRGSRVTPNEARRIYVHEVYGHLLVRRRAVQQGCPPGRVGSVAADVDEEGRAVLLEQGEGLLGGTRQQELACRHLLAEAVFVGEGASGIAKNALLLRDRGLPSRQIAEALVRVTRGGGLAREIIYLPGLLRVSEASGEPGVLDLLSRGRFSVEAARVLLRDLPPSPQEGLGGPLG